MLAQLACAFPRFASSSFCFLGLDNEVLCATVEPVGPLTFCEGKYRALSFPPSRVALILTFLWSLCAHYSAYTPTKLTTARSSGQASKN